MRKVNIRELKKGSGMALIHWFEITDLGPAKTPEGIVGGLKAGGVRGRIACMPMRNSVTSEKIGATIEVLIRSDNINAVNCPICMETEGFKKAKSLLDSLTEASSPSGPESSATTFAEMNEGS